MEEGKAITSKSHVHSMTYSCITVSNIFSILQIDYRFCFVLAVHRKVNIFQLIFFSFFRRLGQFERAIEIRIKSPITEQLVIP